MKLWGPLLGALIAIGLISPPSLAGQEHEHRKPSQGERDRLNQEWDRQYLEWQQRLASGPEIRRGMVVADLGAGRGGLTRALSERVGTDGHVFANDIDPRMLEILRQLAGELGNITVIEGEQNDPLLPRDRVDVAFLIKVYHQLTDKVEFLRATREELKPGALLFIVDVDVNQDWGEGKGSVSDPEQCKADALAAGFEIVSIERFPITNWKLYQLVVSKPS
jgi:ubiquinone/menaquinone biosynthesis C-methylase UbiE